MHVEFEVPDHAAVIERLLDGFISAGELLIRAGAAGKPRLEMVLQDDDVPTWQLPTQSEERLTGDCEDLVIWWGSWLRARGNPRVRARIKNVGPKEVHCLLDLGNGKIVDVYKEHLEAQSKRGFQMGGFGSFVSSLGHAVSKGVSHGVRAVGHTLSQAAQGLGDVGAGIGHGIAAGTRATTGAIADAAKATYHGVGDAASAVGRGVEATAVGIADAAKATYHGVGDAASAVGHGLADAATATYHGIGDAAGQVEGFAGDVLSGAADLAVDIAEAPTKYALELAGDIGSRVMDDVGRLLTPDETPEAQDNAQPYDDSGQPPYDPSEGEGPDYGQGGDDFETGARDPWEANGVDEGWDDGGWDGGGDDDDGTSDYDDVGAGNEDGLADDDGRTL